MPDVLELTIEPGRRAASTFSSSARLTSSRSTTASMIQSPSLIRRKAVVEAAGRDQLPGVGREERIGLERARALQPLLGGVGRDVEQQRRNAGVGEVRGNLGAHGAGAEHGDRANMHLRGPPVV